MKMILFTGILVLTKTSFAVKTQEVSIKPDTSVVILNVYGDDCRFDDFDMNMDLQQEATESAQEKTTLKEVKLSMIEVQDDIQNMIDLIRSRIAKSAPTCLEAVSNASSRPYPAMCFRPRKQISIFLDDSLKFHNDRIFSLKNGKFLLTTADGVTVKVLQIKKN